jgi:small subunit ribosomal protein S1
VDLSALTSMLNARWKGGGGASGGGASGSGAAGARVEALSVGQVRSFRILQMDRGTEKIEIELV